MVPHLHYESGESTLYREFSAIAKGWISKFSPNMVDDYRGLVRIIAENWIAAWCFTKECGLYLFNKYWAMVKHGWGQPEMGWQTGSGNWIKGLVSITREIRVFSRAVPHFTVESGQDLSYGLIRVEIEIILSRYFFLFLLIMWVQPSLPLLNYS